jgi:hypothetical protein
MACVFYNGTISQLQCCENQVIHSAIHHLNSLNASRSLFYYFSGLPMRKMAKAANVRTDNILQPAPVTSRTAQRPPKAALEYSHFKPFASSLFDRLKHHNGRTAANEVISASLQRL